jgi:hypothetical protein
MQVPASLRSDFIHIASERSIHIVGIRTGGDQEEIGKILRGLGAVPKGKLSGTALSPNVHLLGRIHGSRAAPKILLLASCSQER